MLSRSDETPEDLNVGAIKEKYQALTNVRIKLCQQRDPDCLTIINNIKNNTYKNKEYILDDDSVLLKQVFPLRLHGWRFRVVIPRSLVNEVIYNYHDRVYSGHLSLAKVIWKVKQVFTWTSMFHDINHYIRSCESCQRRNVTRTKAPFQSITASTYPMQRLNVDILGPFTPSFRKRNKYLVIYTDSLTRYVIASALPNIEAETVAKDYIENVFSVHGGSQEIVSDRGGQFTGHIFESLCKKLGIKHLTTSSYRPCSNGISERVNRKTLNILAHVCNKYYNDWDSKLPFVLHALRTCPHRSTGDTPFYLFHGFDAIDPAVEASHKYREAYDSIPDFVEKTVSDIELIRAEVAENLTLSSKENCMARNKGRKLKEFNIGQQVLYLDTASYAGKNRKLRQRYKGPYRIIIRLGLVNYKIRSVENPKDIRTAHVDKLKTYFPRFVLDDIEQPNKRLRGNKSSRNFDNDNFEIDQNEDQDDMFYFPVVQKRGGAIEGDTNCDGQTDCNGDQNIIERNIVLDSTTNTSSEDIVDLPSVDEDGEDVVGNHIPLFGPALSPSVATPINPVVMQVPLLDDQVSTAVDPVDYVNDPMPSVSNENSEETDVVSGRSKGGYNLRDRIYTPIRYRQ